MIARSLDVTELELDDGHAVLGEADRPMARAVTRGLDLEGARVVPGAMP